MSLMLVPAVDADLAWMLGEANAPDGLTLPPGGVDTPQTLKWVRRTLPALGPHGAWMLVDDGEVVALCSYIAPPTPRGEVEIGYGVAPERRGSGYGSQISKLLLEAARGDPRVRALTAETALGNIASQRMLVGNGFFKTGRGWDDEEGETIRWRLELRDAPPPTAAPPGLFERRLDTLYEMADGRMVRSNEWNGRIAPRFHLMLTAEGALTRFRGDVPTDVARRLDEIAAGEVWDPAAAAPPRRVDSYVEALAAHAPVEAIASGPVSALLRAATPLGPTLDISAENAGLLREGLGDYLEDVGRRGPFVGVVQGGAAVSICFSSRISPAAHCAGVETHPEHRQRGHALVAVSAWAGQVQGLGATPFYSTTWDNLASRAVAERLGFQRVATDLQIT